MKKTYLIFCLIIFLSISINSQKKSINLIGNYQIENDETGNSYIAGNFDNPSINFGNTTLYNLGNNDIFIAKYDLNGKIIWANNIGSIGEDVIENFSVEKNGNILLTINSNNSSYLNESILLFKEASAKILFDNEGHLNKVEELKKETYLRKGKQSFSLTYPNGGENFNIGTNKKITWDGTADGDINLKFEYSTNNGISWHYIATVPAYLNFYNWTVPNTPSQECKIRFINLSDSTVSDECQNEFVISGQLNWYKQASVTAVQLNSVYFLNEETGYAAGFDGIFKTDDGGNSWIQQLSGFGLISIHFADQNTGYAVGLGGSLFKTTDAGNTWQQKYSGTSNTLTEIQFINPSIGWIIGAAEIFRTTNGGINWTSCSPTSHILTSLFFINEFTGWVVGGEGVIYKTTNGGIDWAEQQSNSTLYSQLNSVYFIDENRGWACGSGLDIDGGVIIKTIDGGSSWNLIYNGWNIFLYSVYFLDSENGWAIGNEGLIITTSNGGNSWTEKGSGVNDDLLSVNFINCNNGWSVGSNGTIIKYSPNSINPPSWMADISVSVSSGLESVLIFGQSSHATNEIDIILDEKENSNTPSSNQFDVKFELLNSKNSKKDFRNILESQITWKIKFQPGYAGYPVEFFWDPNNLPAGTFILRDPERANLNINMKEISSFCAESNLISDLLIEYAAGPLPVEIASFTALNNNNFVDLNWITSMEKNNKGFEIYRKKIGENSLEPEWKSIGFIEGNGSSAETNYYGFEDKLISAGLYHYRLKQIDFDGSFEFSKIVSVTINNPSVFRLEQNYPNPFNPNTVIRWQLQASSYVLLKVYDVLGNEVAVLVDAEQPAGNYEINFDGSNLSSGVYIYKLSAGNLTNTRKMILTK